MPVPQKITKSCYSSVLVLGAAFLLFSFKLGQAEGAHQRRVCSIEEPPLAAVHTFVVWAVQLCTRGVPWG